MQKNNKKKAERPRNNISSTPGISAIKEWTPVTYTWEQFIQKYSKLHKC